MEVNVKSSQSSTRTFFLCVCVRERNGTRRTSTSAAELHQAAAHRQASGNTTGLLRFAFHSPPLLDIAFENTEHR